MKRFRFSLQRVLEYRRQQEDLERGRLALLAAERVRLERQAEGQGVESREMRAACAAAGTLPAIVVRQAFEAGAGLLRARERSLDLAKQVEQKRLQQLGVVMEARRRVRLLELLRRKRKLRHVRAADQEMEAIAGELHLAKLRRESPK